MPIFVFDETDDFAPNLTKRKNPVPLAALLPAIKGSATGGVYKKIGEKAKSLLQPSEDVDETKSVKELLEEKVVPIISTTKKIIKNLREGYGDSVFGYPTEGEVTAKPYVVGFDSQEERIQKLESYTKDLEEYAKSFLVEENPYGKFTDDPSKISAFKSAVASSEWNFLTVDSRAEFLRDDLKLSTDEVYEYSMRSFGDLPSWMRKEFLKRKMRMNPAPEFVWASLEPRERLILIDVVTTNKKYADVYWTDLPDFIQIAVEPLLYGTALKWEMESERGRYWRVMNAGYTKDESEVYASMHWTSLPQELRTALEEQAW